MAFSDALAIIGNNFPLFWTIIIVIIVLVLFNFALTFTKRYLLKKARTKRQVSNIKVLTRIISIAFTIIVIFVGFFSYIGSWTGLGVFVGLLTAALGFALQKPITGIAAWIMVIVKKPFRVGDRIAIGEVKGDVYDITLTHVYIDEIGGLAGSDQVSGRNIMIPNHLLFEHNIINYTLIHDYVLGEVSVDVTYESNLDKAMKIAKESAIKFTKEHLNAIKKEALVRIKMESSCMNIRVMFFAPVKIMQETASNITKEIYDRIKKEKDVEIAYPHTEIVFKDKGIFKGKMR